MQNSFHFKVKTYQRFFSLKKTSSATNFHLFSSSNGVEGAKSLRSNFCYCAFALHARLTSKMPPNDPHLLVFMPSEIPSLWVLT